ncbi:hypothetical protein C8Q72DRAFT_955549 [Fomitopsis betulina]|nr:hypothetical protein C8Q72DRAFT_955549 [Fomitopsis betulina]
MHFSTAFPLLLAALAFVPASVLALPFEVACDGMELQARMSGAEPSHYSRRALDDIELLVRALDVDELLAVRDAANLHGFNARAIQELEARVLFGIGRSRPAPAPAPNPGGAPTYSEHDPHNGKKPMYSEKDPHPKPRYSYDDPYPKGKGKKKAEKR